jgi:hypothetical protein
MQVCKYDAPRRRRRGRVTTERRKSVGAEREQKGEREGWRHGRWLGASPATQAYVVTDDTEEANRGEQSVDRYQAAGLMVAFTTLCLLFNICWLLVIYHRLNAYLQLLRRRADDAKLSEAGDVPCDSGIEWTLASKLEDNVSIYTAIDASRFSLRFVVGSLPTGTAELMCLLREVDLIPTWNAFCAWGGVLRVASAIELWVGAVLALPWPVPRHAILVHAQLHDRMAEEGCVLIEAATPATFADALPAPLSACTHSLPIAMSVGRLTPLPPAASGPRTAADVQVPPLRTLCPCTFAVPLCCPPPLCILALHPWFAPSVQMTIELQGLGWMGGVASGVPQWLLNLILFVVAPLVYRRALAVLADLSPESALGARLLADQTGVYARLRHMTGQRRARPQAAGAENRTE